MNLNDMTVDERREEARRIIDEFVDTMHAIGQAEDEERERRHSSAVPPMPDLYRMAAIVQDGMEFTDSVLRTFAALGREIEAIKQEVKEKW